MREEIDKKLSYKGLVSTALEEGIVVELRPGGSSGAGQPKRRGQAVQ